MIGSFKMDDFLRQWMFTGTLLPFKDGRAGKPLQKNTPGNEAHIPHMMAQSAHA
jgi:hypothetical protein